MTVRWVILVTIAVSKLEYFLDSKCCIFLTASTVFLSKQKERWLINLQLLKIVGTILFGCYVFVFLFQTDFRCYWLQTKLQEEPLVSEASEHNPVSLLIISTVFYDCVNLSVCWLGMQLSMALCSRLTGWGY